MSAPAPHPILAPVGRVATAAVCHRHRGALRVTLIAKATFAWVHEGAAMLERPDPIATSERHHRDNPTASIQVASDLAPRLPRAEVVLTGHAYAPAREPKTQIIARLVITRDAPLVDKRVLVVGDRGAPIQRVPLVYERAYGGPGFRDNPLGVGFSGGGTPTLLDPERPDRTACFAPIARAWPSRKQRIGNDARKALDAPIAELADDFDFDYFQQAPEDQRLDRLEGDEEILLEGMHPELERVRTRLPNARAIARVHGLEGRGLVEVALAADTLRIDTDRRIASLTFRASVPVASEATIAGVRADVGVSIANEPIAWPAQAPALATPAPRAERRAEPKVTGGTMTLGDGDLEIVADEPAAPAIAAGGTVIIEPPPESTPAGHAPPRLEGTVVLEDDAGRRLERPASRFEGTVVLDDDAQHAIAAAPPSGPAFLAGDAKGAPAAPPAPSAPASTASAPSAPPAPRDNPLAGTFAIDAAALASIAARPATPFVAPPPGAAPAIAAHADAPALREHPLSGTLEVTPEQQAQAARRSATPFREPIVERLVEAPSVRGLEVESAARFFHSIERPAAPEPESARVVVPERKSETVPVLHDDGLVVTTVAWQVRPPRHTLTIIAKHTFDLVPDGPARARAHTELPTGDRYHGGDASKSVTYPSDYALFKPRADVVLSGTAYAPNGSTPAAMVRFRFGHEGHAFDRKIAVFGRRVWEKGLLGLSPSAPEPFKKVSLVYEHAFGGKAFAPNPVGLGHAPSAGADLPSLEDPAHLITSSKDAPRPACFAAISPFWKERWGKLGTYDAKWLGARWPYFPDDFDWNHFQSAPEPQRLDHLKGDEPFTIVGMHPDRPVLEGTLPGVRARAFVQETEAGGGRFREITLRLDTACFDVDSMRLDLVFRGLVEVSEEEAPEIQALFVLEEPLAAAPISLEEARDRLLRKLVPLTEVAGETAPPANDAPAPTAAPEAERHPRLVALEAEIEQKRAERLAALREKGISEAAIEEALAPREPGDPRQVLERLRAANARSELLEAFEKVLDPDPAAPEPTRREQILARIAAGDPLDELDAQGEDLAGIDFTGRSLARANLKDALLSGAVLTKADLSGARLAGADLADASLEGAVLDHADLHGAKLDRARLDHASLAHANLGEVSAEKASFRSATGERASFARGRLHDAVFDEAELPRADFMQAELPRASFVDAGLADALLFGARAAEARFDGAKLARAGFEGAELSGASFVAVHAPGSNWEKAELANAHFDRAELEGASFIRASCEGALFSRADLRRACFRRATLVNAKLLQADLLAASLERADLHDADLRGANLHGAETWNAKLEGAQLDLAIVTQTKLRGRP